MRNEYSTFATDFYINQRLNLKMDLSMRRDTVLSLFDRVRRDQPTMDRFKRYTDELALESRPEGGDVTGTTQQWVAVRKTSVRSGSVNPESRRSTAAGCTGSALESALVFSWTSARSISTIFEVLYGFDLMATPGNHDTPLSSTPSTAVRPSRRWSMGSTPATSAPTASWIASRSSVSR